MIFETINVPGVLAINSEDDYPVLATIKPAIEQAMKDSVGTAWLTANAADPAVRHCAVAMLMRWFQSPDAIGEMTPGIMFLLTQLQIRALGYTPPVEEATE